MGELEDHLGRALRLGDFSTQREIRTRGGSIDLVIRSGDDAYIVEIKTETARMDALGQVHLIMQNPDLLGAFQPPGKLMGVLAAPSFSRHVEALAERMKIATLTIPMRLLGHRATNLPPLTTPKAWNVVAETIALGHNPGVRRLAVKADASVGWTSGVVRSLQARGILAEDGEMSNQGILRLMDQIATERPLARLRTASVDTGLNWDDAIRHLQHQWPDIAQNLHAPGFHLCGQTASMEYDDRVLNHGAIQAYATDAETLKLAMQGLTRERGVQFNIYLPDRSLGRGRGNGPTRCVTLRQALLDVAGMGFAARDTALRLVEVMQREY